MKHKHIMHVRDPERGYRGRVTYNHRTGYRAISFTGREVGRFQDMHAAARALDPKPQLARYLPRRTR